MEAAEGFRMWLRTNRNVLETTINLYVRTISRFLSEYNEPTLENINEFVSKSFRDKNSGYVKYAFKHYLEYIGKPELYDDVVRVRHGPRKKKGVYVPRNDLLEIVQKVSPEAYRIVALIQMCTGARAHEILSVKKDDIDRECKNIRIVTKGGNERFIHIPERFRKDILSFVNKRVNPYPFLRGALSGSLRKVVYNNYRYYYNSVKRAAASVGYPRFSTHDFRRNFANELDEMGYNLTKIQRALGHARIETTVRYIEKSKETHKEAVEMLWG